MVKQKGCSQNNSVILQIYWSPRRLHMIMSDRSTNGLSLTQEIASLRRGIKLKDEAYTSNTLLIIIRQLEKSNENSTSYALTGSNCSLIEQLFDVFPRSQTVVVNALVILNNLISSSTATHGNGSNNPIWKQLLSRTESCSGLIIAIASHLPDHAVATQSLQLILSLSSQESPLKKMLDHQHQRMRLNTERTTEGIIVDEINCFGISDVLLKLMRDHSDNSQVMEQICHILYNLTYEDDDDMSEECRDYLSELGAGELLLAKLVGPMGFLCRLGTEKIQLCVVAEEDSGITSHTADVDTKDTATHLDLELTALSKVDQGMIFLTENETNNVVTSKHSCTQTLASQPAAATEFSWQPVRDMDIGLAKWGMRALGSLCRHHVQNQQVFHRLGACEMVMHVKNSIADSSHTGDDMVTNDTSFLESFCWAVGNLADPEDGCKLNQEKLLENGACEAVLGALKDSCRTKGHLTQEGCRALRNLCNGNEGSLQRMHALGVCNILLDIVFNKVTLQYRSPPSASRSGPTIKLSPDDSSTVQWAWFAVSALCRDDEDDDISCSAIKSEIRSTFSELNTCSLLRATCNAYGTSSSSSAGSADVIQWCFAAMAALTRDTSIAKQILPLQPSVATVPAPGILDDQKSIVDFKHVNAPTKVSSSAVDSSKNYSFFLRAMSSGHSSNNSADALETKGTLNLEGASEQTTANTLIVLQAMNAHINNVDVVEEFCNVICALISTSSGDHSESAGDHSDDFTSRLHNRQLLIAANTIEHLVKILAAHGRVVSEDDVEAAVVIGSVFRTISLLIVPQSLTGTSRLVDPVEDSTCVDRLVVSGLLRVLPRILAQPYALVQFSSIAMCGLQLLNDIACCRSPHHDVLAKSNVAVSLVALLHAHVKWKAASILAVQTMSCLASGSHCRVHISLLQTAGCCSALVQAVCIHYRGGEICGRGEEEIPDSSMILLQCLVQCISDLLDANRILPTELIECRASFVREGSHEAMALVMRTLKISNRVSDVKAKNVVVSSCIEVICRLSALPCSVLERLDRQSLSLSCLSLLFLSDSSSILNCASVFSAAGSSSAEEIRVQYGIPVSIGSYAVRGTGVISKENDNPALGSNVCSSIGSLVSQAIDLLFPTTNRTQTPEADSFDSCEGASAARLGTCDRSVGAHPSRTISSYNDGEASKLLKSCCAAVEGLVASHRHHRWLLAQAGVSRSLLHALRLCLEYLEASSDLMLMDLATSLCLAIGSIAKDSEESAVSKGSRGELDLVLQALPVFCRLLDVCAQLEGSGSPPAAPSVLDTDRIVQVETDHIADNRLIASTSLSAAICRAVSHIAAAQGRHAILFYYQRNTENAPGGNGLEGCVLKALHRTHHSLSASYECCLAIAELALNDADSAHRMCVMGVNRKLAQVFAVHISSVQFEATLSTFTSSQILDHEVEVFCMVWCRALYALLKVLGHTFFAINEENAERVSQDKEGKLSPESLASMLLNVANSDWASSSVAASICMALSALIGACRSTTQYLPDGARLEITILSSIMSNTLQKHVVQADWFTLSLQQAAHSISFTKSVGGGAAGSPTFSATVTAAGAGGVAYWCSVFLYQLILSSKTDVGHHGVSEEASLQLQIRSTCLSLNLCELFHRALGKFSQEESIMAACYMAISALLSETDGASEEGARALRLDSTIDDTRTDLLLATKFAEANEQNALSLSIHDARKRFNCLGLGPMIVDTLKEYPSSKHVTDWCLRCMCLLFEHSEETVHKMSSLGICEMLPVCMQAHQSSAFASISGCLAIYRIIHSSQADSAFTLTPPTHQQSSTYAVRLGGAGACEAVMSVYSCHGGNASAIESASRALAALSFASKGNAGWLGPLGACDALLVAHDRHSRNLEVVSSIWNAIGTLCSYNRERLSGLGIAQRIISSLQLHFNSGSEDTLYCIARSSVASSAAFAIGRLCEPLHGAIAATCLSNRIALCAAGCCGVLTSVLRIEYLNVAASTNICRAISTLCNGLHCSQERSEFGMHGIADALVMAMKEHVGHEEAALYSCHAVRSLCSYGDLTNQRLLRRAGICELVAMILHESLQIAAVSPQVSIADSIAGHHHASSRRGAREVESLFSQMLSRARAYSQPASLSGKSGSGPPSTQSVGPGQSTLMLSEVLPSRADWKPEWRDKTRVSLAAIRAVCCLSCTSNSVAAVDHAGSNISTKASFGSKGVLEAMVELGTSGCVQTDVASTAIPSLSQWITLALCHLIDPSNDIRHDNDSDEEDIDFLKTVHKVANPNLSRLCFCNRTGEFLVTSILIVTASNSTVPPGDVDALVYNALSIAVCMCEDKVGSHKVFSAEGFSKMLLQLINRYSIPAASTEATWLLLLTFSLASSAASSTVVSDKLVQGGILRLLAATLLAQLLPSATGVIRQLSSSDPPSRLVQQQIGPILTCDGSITTSISAPGALQHSEIKNEDRVMTGNQRYFGAGATDGLHTEIAASSQTYQLMVRSDFEASSFIAPIISDVRKDGTRHYSTGASYRITSGLRSVINIATTCISDGSKVDCDFDACDNDVMTLALAKEGCCALSSLLSASCSSGSAASEMSSPQEGKGIGAVRARAFSSAIGLYRDTYSGGIAGLGAGNAANLVTSLNALVLVADSSLMFFSNERSSSQSRARQRVMEHDVTHSKVDDGTIRRQIQGPTAVDTVPLLLPAVKELRNAALVSYRHMQQLLQRPV